MQRVVVKKENLEEVVASNLENHAEKFEEAYKAYEEKAISLLEESLAKAKTKGIIQVDFGLVRPQDHTDDYRRVLNMLNMSVEDEIPLEYHEFEQLVEDKWGWHKQFAQAYTSNTGIPYRGENASI